MSNMILRETEEWLARHRPEIIHCPHQPGNLLITKESCRKRRIKARMENYADIMKGDVLDYIHKSGLLLCRDCRLALNQSNGKKVIPFSRPEYGSVARAARA
ncbi:MAG: hypothetical protein NTV99_10350 [Deltaproteobacteria bacterium]|nr:hypothetical protein [Deltaproteobacteria bacterium]